MASQTFNLTYDGYWREVNMGGVPNESGVYTVYAATYDSMAKTVALRKVIYIGESADVGARIANHEKAAEWKRHLQRGEVLCFNFAPVPTAARVRVEAALINHHKPPVNTEYVDNFPFDSTTITTTGRSALLSPSFTVDRTRVAARW